MTDSPWLQGLEDAAKGDLFRSAELRMVNKGAFLFRQGDDAARAIVLVKRRIKLVRTASNGRDLILCFIGPGHPFGLVASMLGGPQRISAQAVEPSAVLAWTRELLHRMLGLPQLVINLARIIAERLEATRDRLQDLSTERVEQRVARAVMRLGASLARSVGDDAAIELLVSQQDLAELADTTPYSISRILSHWKRLGWLAWGAGSSIHRRSISTRKGSPGRPNKLPRSCPVRRARGEWPKRLLVVRQSFFALAQRDSPNSAVPNEADVTPSAREVICVTVVRPRDDSPKTTASLDDMLPFDNTPWERLWRVVANLEQQREQLAWRIRTLPHAPRAGPDTLASVLRK